jgi:hypothetical protein
LFCFVLFVFFPFASECPAMSFYVTWLNVISISVTIKPHQSTPFSFIF